ncbi:hypothetical protein BHU72_12610 [Desulfuribacillus stibiiarsenatis]|uniref:M23ase beta-sheet core domain-containing protein n=1 Tax=Desulfuribacillus stibiiarsenatis TaxID=1390249 RepID=A0A1E5L2S5_9FIRM|nr:M23 family metallopeptidase [Desulfuribacillus stibiiarsenatis]OEH84239.1 hypothetical protein BHU72_12610 [Desulfuribacillus stibiiarsenatis]
MRINLEGVKRRREDMIDQLKFGSNYSIPYARQASPMESFAKNNKSSSKWIIQSVLALTLVFGTVFIKQIPSPWAQSSVTFVQEVVTRDYNWEGALQVITDQNFWSKEALLPAGSNLDPSLHNEFGKFPNDPLSVPVFQPFVPDGDTNANLNNNPNAESNGNSNSNSNTNTNTAQNAQNPSLPNSEVKTSELMMPIDGLLVRKFTDEKPYIEFIAFDNKNVVAVTDGKVKQVGHNELNELLVYVEDANYTYVYGRLKESNVKVGDTVKKGQKIATVSPTNEIDLLLFQIIKGDKAIDPELILP